MGAVRGGRGLRWRAGRLRVELAWLGYAAFRLDFWYWDHVFRFALGSIFCRTSVLQGAGWDGWVVFLES